MNKKAFIIGTLLLGAAAAAWWIKGQITLMGQMLYSIKSYTLKSISRNGIVLLLDLNIENKGAFEVDVQGYDFDIYGDDNFLVRAVSKQYVKIKPFSESMLPIEIVINPKVLASGIGGAITGSSAWKDINLKISGSISVKKGAIPFPIPIKYTTTIREITESK